MSDEKNDPRDTADVETLRLPIDQEVRTYASSGGKSVSAEEARSLIRGRFDGIKQDMYSAKFVDAFASLLVESLDAEMMQDTVIKAIDMRPYLAALAADGRLLPGVAMDSVAGRRDIYDRSLESLRQGLDDEAQAIGVEVNIQTGVTGGEAAGNLSQIGEVDETSVGLSPSARYASRVGQVNNNQLPSNQLDEAVFGGSGYDDVLNAPVWSEASAIAATMLPPTFLEPAIKFEADFNEEAGTPGMVRGGIILETGAPPDRVPPNRNDRRRFPAPSQRPKDKMLSYGQAASYMNSLTDAAYTDMQSKMATAGYYDQLGARYVAGDGSRDKATAHDGAMGNNGVVT